MVAQPMARSLDLLEDGAIACHVFSDAKEGSLDSISCKHIQHPRGNLGCGTVVKCQIDALWLRRDAPEAVLKHQTTKPCGWLLDEHAIGLLKQVVLVVSKVEVMAELVGVFLVELMIAGILSHLERIAHREQLLADGTAHSLYCRLV